MSSNLALHLFSFLFYSFHVIVFFFEYVFYTIGDAWMSGARLNSRFEAWIRLQQWQLSLG